MKKRGCFITFEGPEGSGKSTLIREAQRLLGQWGFQVLVLREPGSTAISEKIRKILLDNKHHEILLETELFLYLAARAQIVRERILPSLSRGKIVICDRYHDSTVAYQGYGAGLSLKMIERCRKLATAGLEPDLTFLLDVESAKGLRRSGRRDRMERKSKAFHRRVRHGFLALAKKERSRIVVIKDEPEIRRKAEKMGECLRRFMAHYSHRNICR